MLKTKVGAWIVGGALILGSGVALAGEGALETADEPVLESTTTATETETTRTESTETETETKTKDSVTNDVEADVDEVKEEADEAAGTDEPKDNHGALVSKAAHCEVPEGYANRGKFVSAVAQGEADAVAEVEGCTTKGEETADTDGDDEDADKAEKKQKPAKAHKQGKSAGAGKGRGTKK